MYRTNVQQAMQRHVEKHPRAWRPSTQHPNQHTLAACFNMERGGGAWLLLLLLPLSCLGAEHRDEAKAVSRARKGGTILTRASDGSWVQTSTLFGAALPGWAGLRTAFTRQLVEISCSDSQV